MLSLVSRSAVIVTIALFAGCSAQNKYDRVTGDTPSEISLSLTLMAENLPPEKQSAFIGALDMIRTTAQDRMMASKVASITPQMAQQLRGRTADDVIQMAAIYRSAIPVYPSNRELAQYRAPDK
jgi:hypothetical protein